MATFGLEWSKSGKCAHTRLCAIWPFSSPNWTWPTGPSDPMEILYASNGMVGHWWNGAGGRIVVWVIFGLKSIENAEKL